VDDQRFDSLARVVAGLGSRRAILRGLAGAAALAAWGRRGAPASAQYGNLGPGDACYDDSQCSSSLTYGTPLVCADNGFDYDGPLNCCTGEGSYCFSDEGCCSWAYCDANQRCSFASSPGPSPSFGPNAGDPCQTTDQCNRPVTGAICEYTDYTGDNRCCWYEGSLCSSGAQCCGSRICSNGVCQFPGGGSGTTGGGTATPGDPCRPGIDTCVYASGAFFCDFVGSTGDYRCCAYGGDRCGWDGQCCGDFSCFNGTCRPMAGGSGTISSSPGPGDPCQPGVDVCIYASGAFTCDFVGSTGDFRCCAYGGDRCGWDGECCGDFGCFNGVCRGMAGGSGTG
jgi:hypothetical protein